MRDGVLELDGGPVEVAGLRGPQAGLRHEIDDAARLGVQIFKQAVSQNLLLHKARIEGDTRAEDHLSRFIVALVRESLDPSEIEASYNSHLGQPPFHPALMMALLLNGYADKKKRLAKIREAKAALEAEAKAAAEEEARRRAEAEAEENRKAEGRKRNGPPAPPSAEPDGKAQRNFSPGLDPGPTGSHPEEQGRLYPGLQRSSGFDSKVGDAKAIDGYALRGGRLVWSV